METESSLPHSQEKAKCPCSYAHESSPCPHSTSWKPILILCSHLRLGLPSCLFPSGFVTKRVYTTLLSLIRDKCPVHLMIIDFIIRIIFGEQSRSLSSSLCSFLHTPLTCYHLGPNIVLSTHFSNTLSLRSYLMWASKFYTHMKPQAKI